MTATAAKRMALSAITRTKKNDAPLRILGYGVEGIGKSSFAAEAPNPVFIGPEDGTPHLETAKFPEPHSYQDLIDAGMELIAGKHDYQTVVYDTLDWIEPLVWKETIRQANKADIKNVEDFGYGKGYIKALDLWRQLLSIFERLRAERGMHIILLGHSQQKTWKNPEGDDFDRYTLKINEKAAGLCKEWCDVVLFMNYETYADKDKRDRVRGLSTGARLIHTQRTAAYDAKNRYSLPNKLPLNWGEFMAAVRGERPADPNDIKGAIDRILQDANNEQAAAWAQEQIKKAPDNAAFLAKVLDTLRGKFAAAEQR